MSITKLLAFYYAKFKEQDLRFSGAVSGSTMIVWVLFSKDFLGLGTILSLALTEVCAFKTTSWFWKSYLVFVGKLTQQCS